MIVAFYDKTTGEFEGPVMHGLSSVEEAEYGGELAAIEIPQGVNINTCEVDLKSTPPTLKTKNKATLKADALSTEKQISLAVLSEKFSFYEGKVLTPRKETVYRLKASEVERFKSDKKPNPKDYPFLSKEGKGLGVVASEIESRIQQTNSILAELDALERSCKQAIQSASELGEAKQALNKFCMNAADKVKL